MVYRYTKQTEREQQQQQQQQNELKERQITSNFAYNPYLKELAKWYLINCVCSVDMIVRLVGLSPHSSCRDCTALGYFVLHYFENEVESTLAVI